MRFRYLHPLYGFDGDQSHIGAPKVGEKKLREMAGVLAGTEDLAAIYIPEGTDDVYRPGNKRGRVVGGVQLLPMPEGKDISDYVFSDWDDTVRWPMGWPCRAVYAPPVSECSTLRSIVDQFHGPNTFGAYLGRCQKGPFELDGKVAGKLDEWFRQFPVLGAG